MDDFGDIDELVDFEMGLNGEDEGKETHPVTPVVFSFDHLF